MRAYIPVADMHAGGCMRVWTVIIELSMHIIVFTQEYNLGMSLHQQVVACCMLYNLVLDML